MAKKTKDTTATTASKDGKAKALADPAKTRSLIRLLNILALLLAIAAFLLQFFAVISHHWKWQVTGLRPILSPNNHEVPSNGHDDGDIRLEQRYGLRSRDIKLYAHNDEQLSVLASTRFPRIDDGEENFHGCLSRTSTLRGALLTCSDRIISPEQCHCRRYPYWNAVIFFEIVALILLGIVVLICALLTTQYEKLLKLAGVGLSFLAFLFMLIGLILILSHLKRETRTIADTYPHTYQRLANNAGVAPQHRHQHQVVRRQAHETYRAYNLLPGQNPHNTTHFVQFSEQQNAWVAYPYTSLNADAYVPRSQQGRVRQSTAARQTTTEAPLYNSYGPLLGYDQVYEHTRAGIGWSTVLSILSLILALLLPAILAFSWLTGNKLGPEVKTVTTTTVRTEYVPVPQEVTVETVPLNRPIPTEYDSRRPVGEAVVTTQNVRQGPYDNYGAPVAVHTRDEHPSTTQTYRT
jgi:hypothetical protein